LTTARNDDPRPFLLGVAADAYPASQEVQKVYRALPDPVAEAKGFVRVIDESRQGYLYPHRLFVVVKVPREAAESLLAATASGPTH
jgi:hypothetical protein